MILRRRPRDLHLRPRRIGPDHAEILACEEALMAGARGQDRDIARRDLDFLARIAAEPHPRTAAGDVRLSRAFISSESARRASSITAAI